jgi:hypothetical protein
VDAERRQHLRALAEAAGYPWRDVDGKRVPFTPTPGEPDSQVDAFREAAHPGAVIEMLDEIARLERERNTAARQCDWFEDECDGVKRERDDARDELHTLAESLHIEQCCRATAERERDALRAECERLRAVVSDCIYCATLADVPAKGDGR